MLKASILNTVRDWSRSTMSRFTGWKTPGRFWALYYRVRLVVRINGPSCRPTRLWPYQQRSHHCHTTIQISLAIWLCLLVNVLLLASPPISGSSVSFPALVVSWLHYIMKIKSSLLNTQSTNYGCSLESPKQRFLRLVQSSWTHRQKLTSCWIVRCWGGEIGFGNFSQILLSLVSWSGMSMWRPCVQSWNGF